MATGELEFTNPLGMKSSDDGGTAPAVFEDENGQSSSFEDENIKLSSFENESALGSTDAWGQLAAGEALYMGDIDKAILVSFLHANFARLASFVIPRR
eukprot:COSAG02_NODE_1136_length_14337_cov_50.495505_8_plen_98_part_00